MTVLEGSTGNAITSSLLAEGDPDDHGTGLTYTLTRTTSNGTLFLNGSGALGLGASFSQSDLDAGNVTYSHNGSETTSDSFDFSLADGGEDGAVAVTGTFNILVTSVNDHSVSLISDVASDVNLSLENSAVGSTVGLTAFATDDDAGDSITYTLDDDDGGRFAIDGVTGIVTVAGAIDRETDGAVRTITVRATSSDTSFTTATFTIAVADVNEFSVSPLVDTDGQTNSVNGYGDNGAVVGLTIQSSDADATNNSIVYSLDNDSGGIFAIDSTTGQVSLANASLLDNTAATVRSVTVRATSADGSSKTAVFVIAVEQVPLAAPTNTPLPTPSDDDTNTQPSDEESWQNKKSPRNESTQPTSPKAPSSPQVLVDSASPNVQQPASMQQQTVGLAIIPQDSSAAQTAAEEQLERERLSFMNTTLDDSVAAVARRLAAAAARGSAFNYLMPLSDTVLTLAFDQQNSWDYRRVLAEEKEVRQLVVGTSAVVSGSLSVGYIYWLLRGGSLAASVFSALPAWCSFDPLPIVESFESVRENRNKDLRAESLSNIAAGGQIHRN